jgi:hypothetical protein
MTADFIRGIIVSTAALIMGFSLTSTFFVIKGRSVGRVINVPAWVNWLSVIGYNVLLLSVIIGRWTSVGLPISWPTKLAMFGLALNAVAVIAYSLYIRED